MRLDDFNVSSIKTAILTAVSLLGWIVVLMVKIQGKSFFESEIEWNAFRETTS